MKKMAKYLILFWILFGILISFMGLTRYAVINSPIINGTPKKIILFLSTLVVNMAKLSNNSKPLVFESESINKNKFNYSKNYAGNKDFLLITTWDDSINQSIVKLVRINDQKVIYKWIPDINYIVSQSNLSNKYVVRTILQKNAAALQHPFLMNDGSLIFGSGGIFKIDKNSKLVWSNNTPCHHTIEPDLDGNLWICSYNTSAENSEKYQISDDAIQKISKKTGQILFEKSVFEILMENGYGRGNFFISPQITVESTYLDYMHLNDVQPLLYDSKYWKKGDLFISLRHQNLVMLYRPTTNKIIWSQSGPWLKQHDVFVIDSCRIGIFGNNVIDAQYQNERHRLIDGHNTEYIFDFAKNEYSTPYDELFKSENICTYTGGQARIFDNGDIFIENPDQHKFVYGNLNGEIWTYSERIDLKRVSSISWSRYITENEFRKFTFIDQNNN